MLGTEQPQATAETGTRQLSLPPLLFWSEAVALVRFPASRLRTLSRV